MQAMSEWDWLQLFGDNLKELMRERGWSQADLAYATRMSEPTISSYVNKTRMPGIKAVINIAYVLDIPVESLIDFGMPVLG